MLKCSSMYNNSSSLSHDFPSGISAAIIQMIEFHEKRFVPRKTVHQQHKPGFCNSKIEKLPYFSQDGTLHNAVLYFALTFALCQQICSVFLCQHCGDLLSQVDILQERSSEARYLFFEQFTLVTFSNPTLDSLLVQITFC